MKFTTNLLAIDPKDGVIKEWVGPTIDAPSFELAEEQILKTGLGYLSIRGQLISSIDEETGSTINFENLN